MQIFGLVLPANEIAFKFHGERRIMVGIIRAERGRFYKTQGIIIIDDFHAIVKTCKTSEVRVFVMLVTAVCLLSPVLLLFKFMFIKN